MKYTLTADQSTFFEKNRFIEFEALFNEQDLEKIKIGVGRVLELRRKRAFDKTNEVKKKIYLGSTMVPQEIYSLGYDVTFEDPGIKKIVCTPGLAQIAADLTKKRTLRFGYDQAYEIPLLPDDRREQKQWTLQEKSSIQGVALGVMICVSGESTLEPNTKLEDTSLGIDIFPKKTGNALFFDAKKTIDPSCFLKGSKGTFFLLVYADANALYIFQPEDYHTHFLKKYGYSFGDQLLEKSHPVVFR